MSLFEPVSSVSVLGRAGEQFFCGILLRVARLNYEGSFAPQSVSLRSTCQLLYSVKPGPSVDCLFA